jgi:hypothetical protein
MTLAGTSFLFLLILSFNSYGQSKLDSLIYEGMQGVLDSSYVPRIGSSSYEEELFIIKRIKVFQEGKIEILLMSETNELGVLPFSFSHTYEVKGIKLLVVRNACSRKSINEYFNKRKFKKVRRSYVRRMFTRILNKVGYGKPRFASVTEIGYNRNSEKAAVVSRRRSYCD